MNLCFIICVGNARDLMALLQSLSNNNIIDSITRLSLPQVQNLLQNVQDKFQSMSDQIITRIDDMGNRIDDLEKSIGDLMTQAGVEAPIKEQ